MLPVLFIIAGICFAGVGATSGQVESKDISCFHCHSKQVKEFEKSIHFEKNRSCTDCHGGEIHISGTIISVNVMNRNFTGVPTRANIADMCSKCHSAVTDVYRESIHWRELEKGVEIAATCTDCHGVHDILSSGDPNALTNPENVPLSCAGCHENQTKMNAWYYGIRTDRFDTYKNSYHYKALIGGGRGLATCPDCHENHDTKGEDDPTSPIYPANLPATCGKSGCHAGQNIKIYGGQVHEGQSVYLSFIDAKKLVTYFYIVMILFELTFSFGLIFVAISSRYEIKRRE